MMNDTCTGSLGENIFEDGDFGRGATNILPNDPGIAPDYSYVTFGPPQDGSYTITNATGAWPGLFPTWIDLQDNSSSPDGYMMVVNASFSPGVFYRQQITGLCENTLYEFSADVANLIAQGVTGHIFPNVSFFINDEEAFTTGNVPQTNDWNTYGFTFITDPGTTSLTLSIRNNAPGGIGNDLALDNITFRPCGPDAVITPVGINFVCLDNDPVTISAEVFNSPFAQDFIQWEISTNGGQSWSVIPGASDLSYIITDFASGTYLYRFQLAASPENLNNDKCRVLSETATIIVVPLEYSVTDTICAGASYSVGNSAYTASGIYVDSLISTIGCDSIVTLDLTVVPDPNIMADISVIPPACASDGTGSINITAVRNGSPPYEYQLDDLPPQSQRSFNQLDKNSYTLTIRDRFGCSGVQTVEIPVPPALEVDLGEDISLALGESTVLSAVSNYQNLQYQWSPADVLDCETCSRPNLLPLEDQVIVLEVTNEFGCTATDSIRVVVSKDYPIYAPNVFSPNDDGINDFFTIYARSNAVTDIQKLMIFDRWGKILFERSNIPVNSEIDGWDGFVNGKLAASGVYVFVADISFIDGVVRQHAGSVALIQ
ncbi:MAG: gliding motility-associated C-terminal domain-containing protein [Saprospiraceae bacterium]|nr:gliding motility-associated C-terminal domain-containing protein [Saprospiraceae bacterium]